MVELKINKKVIRENDDENKPMYVENRNGLNNLFFLFLSTKSKKVIQTL